MGNHGRRDSDPDLTNRILAPRKFTVDDENPWSEFEGV